MADEKKAAVSTEKPEDKKAQARAAAKTEPEAATEAAAPAKPNLTQMQVEGYIQNQLCQKGTPPEQAAAEAKKRAAEIVR